MDSTYGFLSVIHANKPVSDSASGRMHHTDICTSSQHCLLELFQIKKSMVGKNEGGNVETPASAGGQAAANLKLHAAKTPAMGSPKAREPS